MGNNNSYIESFQDVYNLYKNNRLTDDLVNKKWRFKIEFYDGFVIKQTTLLMYIILYYPDDLDDFIFKYHPNLNITSKNGYTPLMIASKYSNIDSISNIQIVESLLNYGVSVDIQNKLGQTALMLAVQHSNSTSNETTVEMLIEHGSNLNIQTKDGYSALSIASMFYNTTSTENTIYILLEHGADVDIIGKNGWTPLMLSIIVSTRKDNHNVIQILLNYGSNINKRDNKGWTPLMLGLFKVSDSILFTLLENDAEVNMDILNNRKYSYKLNYYQSVKYLYNKYKNNKIKFDKENIYIE